MAFLLSPDGIRIPRPQYLDAMERPRFAGGAIPSSVKGDRPQAHYYAAGAASPSSIEDTSATMIICSRTLEQVLFSVPM
jgi:hypothetical protein